MTPIYDKQELLDDYLQSGQLARIHRLMLDAFQLEISPGHVCMDLGACVGLLSAGLLQYGASKVLAVEGDQRNLGRRLRDDRVMWVPSYVQPNTLATITAAMHELQPTVCVARRVLYEIDKAGCLEQLAGLMHGHGIKQVLLQGCVPVKNPRSRLWNSELEALALRPYFFVRRVYGPVYYLEAR